MQVQLNGKQTNPAWGSNDSHWGSAACRALGLPAADAGWNMSTLRTVSTHLGLPQCPMLVSV